MKVPVPCQHSELSSVVFCHCFVCFCLFVCHFKRHIAIFQCSFICITLITNDVGHLSMGLSPMCSPW